MTPNTLEICLDKRSREDYFDEILVGRFTRISFHRTLRIPEDGRDYPLPAGLGRLPIHRVEDYEDKVPTRWLEEGGFFIPLYQKEALFLQLEGPAWHPTIAKVCVGEINAITGEPYSEELSKINQDYVVIPNQIWLDGICSGEGLVKQFVAMPLGQGYTVEAQITDEENFGGFQILVYDCKKGRFPERNPKIDRRILHRGLEAADLSLDYVTLMGIASGGSIKQQIQEDSYGFDSWDILNKRRFTIHLVNSLAYKCITGSAPPESPITTAEYIKAEIPWFSNYDEIIPTINPPSIFKRILGVSAINKHRGFRQADDKKFEIHNHNVIKNIRTPDKLEATTIYRQRANYNVEKCFWEPALREISYVIDLDADVRASDFALRSCCNYYLGNYQDGSIDGTLGLNKDVKCHESLMWRAMCWKMLGDHEMMSQDAIMMLRFPETELLGLEYRAEAALLAGNYSSAFDFTEPLIDKDPKNALAKRIRHAAFKEIFGYEWNMENEL